MLHVGHRLAFLNDLNNNNSNTLFPRKPGSVNQSINQSINQSVNQISLVSVWLSSKHPII